MPLSERILGSPLNYHELDKKDLGKTRDEYLLEKLNISGIQGSLNQFAALTRFAFEIFDELHEDISQLYARMGRVGEKVAAIGAVIDTSDEDKIAAMQIVRSDANSYQNLAHFLFSRESMTPALNHRYSQASSPPELDLFDEFTGAEGKCKDKFSYPMFFMEEWVAAERKRQEDAKKKRKQKRNKKKKQNTDEGEKQRIQVDVVKKKKYNVMGAEFAEGEEDGEKSMKHGGSVADRGHQEFPKEESRGDEDHSDVSFSDQENVLSEPHQAKALPFTAFSIVSVSQTPAPVAQESREQSPSAPRASTTAAPAKKNQPAAPVMPRMNLQLKSEISSAKLKPSAKDNFSKTTTLTPQKLSLLDQIKSGKKLKKVTQEELKKQQPKEEEGTLGEIMKLLDRRKFIEDSDSESEDEDWD